MLHETIKLEDRVALQEAVSQVTASTSSLGALPVSSTSPAQPLWVPIIIGTGALVTIAWALWLSYIALSISLDVARSLLKLVGF